MASMTSSELVTTVRSGTSMICLASSKVEVPGPRIIESPGSMRDAAAVAIATFSSWASAVFSRKLNSLASESRMDAPPRVLTSNPSSAILFRSRRTVSAETPSSSASEGMETTPAVLVLERISLRLSAGIIQSFYTNSDRF